MSTVIGQRFISCSEEPPHERFGAGPRPMKEKVVPLRGRRSRIASQETGCPVVCLGQKDGQYMFLSRRGELRVLGYKDVTRVPGLFSLFDGDSAWLVQWFPRFDRRGEAIEGFDASRAGEYLIKACAEKGIYDTGNAVRGRGVWLADGRIFCHTGTQLHYGDGEIRRAGAKIDNAIYHLTPDSIAPATDPATTEDVRAWRRHFDYWRFAPLGHGGADRDRGPDGLAVELVFGTVCLALLGAAPRWRVHLIIRAVHGAGKSRFVDFIAASLGAQAIKSNNFTEPGLRQALANEARTILLDEAEADEPNGLSGGTMVRVIRLIRQMSGGQGVTGIRGTGIGLARHFEIAGSAMMACINMPPLLPQDTSRILVFEMLRALPEHEAAVEPAIQNAEMLSPGIRARALAGWPRFQVNLSHCRGALMRRRCDGRLADLLGGVLAAAAMMRDDVALDEVAADDLAESVVPLIETLQAEVTDASDATSCLRQILSRPVATWRTGDVPTVSRLLTLAQNTNAGKEVLSFLNENCGMRLELREGQTPEAPCLYVVLRQHDFLKSAYVGTRWAMNWGPSLARLEGAVYPENPVRVGGIKVRCVAIPIQHLPTPTPAGDYDSEM